MSDLLASLLKLCESFKIEIEQLKAEIKRLEIENENFRSENKALRIENAELKGSLIDRLIICRSGKILGNDATPFIGDLGIQSNNNCYQFKKAKVIEFSEDVVEVWDRSS